MAPERLEFWARDIIVPEVISKFAGMIVDQ